VIRYARVISLITTHPPAQKIMNRPRRHLMDGHVHGARYPQGCAVFAGSLCNGASQGLTDGKHGGSKRDQVATRGPSMQLSRGRGTLTLRKSYQGAPHATPAWRIRSPIAMVSRAPGGAAPNVRTPRFRPAAERPTRRFLRAGHSREEPPAELGHQTTNLGVRSAGQNKSANTYVIEIPL
jgi:hypothetical protein